MKQVFRAFFMMMIITSLKAEAQNAAREEFNNDWKFILDSAYNDSEVVVNDYSAVSIKDNNWRTLNLPHDWSIEGNFSKDHPATPGGGALPGGMGWYRKTFTLPLSEKGKAVFIDFDGVYHNSEVWINGHSLGVRPNGYISFRYELTPHLKYGTEKNVIAVRVDNSQQPNSRWYSGSGIYRNVWLTATDKLHVDQWGTFVTTPSVTDQEAVVHVATKIKNQYALERPFILRTTIFDKDGKLVAKKEVKGRAGKYEVASIEQDLPVQNPHLWSVEDPYLYQAVSEVVMNGKTVDVYRTPLGIRSFRFDTHKGFFLNGKPLKIMGVCNHHDLGALGAAINTRALERQLEILKAMGCNGIRTSHNPPAPELLELCDRMGFIVMDEAFDMWAKQKNPFDYHLNWAQWHRRDLEDLILRDRNHPSVFIWSVGNEIQEQWGDAAKGDSTGRTIARELVAIVKSLDTTRAITTANNETNTFNNILQSGAFEMIGYNYNHRLWGPFHQRWPGKQFIVTESTSALQTRGHYDLVPFDTIRRWPEAWDKPIKGGGNPDFTVSAYDHVSTPWGSTHEESIKELIKHDHVSGMYVWTGFDYLGEPTPYPWPARSSYFGIIDLAGFPKDVYYLYQSQFTNQPVLHLYPHWNWKAGDTVDVVAYYNNADDVELFLNGQSLGSRWKQGDSLHVKWRLPFTPGVLKAVSRKNGQTVLTKEIKTADAPARIKLTADRSQIKGDGKDLSFITATIVDKDGVMVPKANNLIRFTINGAGFINAVDNGDPTSHESFKSNMCRAFNGLALAIVQSGGKKGKIELRAHADGLEEATIEIDAN